MISTSVLSGVRAQGIGAAWARVLTADDPGYGLVVNDVPEISVEDGYPAAELHRAFGVGVTGRNGNSNPMTREIDAKRHARLGGAT